MNTMLRAVRPAQPYSSTSGGPDKRPPKPSYSFHPENIPAELRAVDRWVNWRYEWNAGKGEWDKPPTDGTGCKADPLDPENWQTFPAALANVRQGHVDGLGVVFVDVGEQHAVKRKGVRVTITLQGGDDLSGSDFDDCVDDADQIAEWARAYVERLDTYTEKSPSGRGVKCFHLGGFPHSGKRGNTEQYTHGRYFTVTGQHWADTPTTTKRRNDALRAINAEVFPPTAKPEPKVTTLRPPSTPPNLSDAELVNEAARRYNGKFTPLQAGNWTGYTSQSEADLALMNYYRNVSGGDEVTMRRLFLTSGLASTLDRKSKPDNYVSLTIAKSLEGWIPNDPRFRPADPSLIVHHTVAEDVAEASGADVDVRLALACLILIARNADLEREAALRRVEVKIAHNPEVKTVREAVKIAAYTYDAAVERGRIKRGEPLKVYLPDLSESLGNPLRPTKRILPNGEPKMEADGSGVGEHLRRYAKTGNLDYISPDPPPGEMRRTLIRFDGADLFEDLAALAEVKDLPATENRPNKWGGLRKTCPACGSDKLLRKTICQDCGLVIKEELVNTEEPDCLRGNMPLGASKTDAYGQDAPRDEIPIDADTPLFNCDTGTTCGEKPVGEPDREPDDAGGAYRQDAPRYEFCPAPATTKNESGGPSCYAHVRYAGGKAPPDAFGGWYDAAGGA